MSKISNISKIRDLIYRLDIYNLQTKIESFPDQEKLLKEMVFSHVVSMNANTKASQKTLYISKVYCGLKAQLVQFTDQKKHLKIGQELKFIF